MKGSDPAFPCNSGNIGMTLRDYFAGLAMIEMIPTFLETEEDKPSDVAQMAYRLADAMIAQRGEDNG